MRSKLNLILLLSFSLAGCNYFGPADGGARIKGEIIDENGEQYSECTIDLLLQENNKLKKIKHMAREIDADFIQSFIIEPKERQYVVDISCEDAIDSYKSEALTLGNLEHYRTPIDLGTIRLKRASIP